jgi:short-subunit dehydrogenase
LKNGDIVLITGASSGIGRELAKVYFARGYKLSLAARSFDKLEQLRKELDPDGNRILVLPADVSREEDCRRIVEATIAHFGTLHILINNAGITMRALFGKVESEVMHRIMDVNFWGAVHCTHYALPELIRNRGSVVGISSVAGYKGLPTRSAYSASKFALEGFLETLRIENLKSGLHVLIARPGFTATNIRNTMVDGKGNAQGVSHKDEAHSLSPEKVALGIYKAVHKRKAYMLMSRTAFLTFWLNKFFPGWVDKQVYNHVKNEKDSPLV